MEIMDKFIPVAGNQDLLSLLTYYTMLVAAYALLASFVFSWLTRTHVAPEHNTSRVLTAIIGLIAGISYFLIQGYYKSFLQEMESVTDPAQRQALSHQAYYAIGQLRYMDWFITTPLLLIKTVMMIQVPAAKVKRLMTLIILGDMFMIVTGYIGEQQLNAAGQVEMGTHLLWGAISTVGYAAVLYGMWSIWKNHRGDANPIELRAFQWMVVPTVTLWGVYPLGYMAIAFFPDLNPDWVHISFSVADVINKVGVGVVAYIAGSQILQQRINVKSTEHADFIG